MSNNSGSRMVNNILEKLKEHYVFNILGKVEYPLPIEVLNYFLVKKEDKKKKRS